MTYTKEWKDWVAQMVLIKQAVAEADHEGLWEHRLPRVGATESQLHAVEQHLGEALDPTYRDSSNAPGAGRPSCRRLICSDPRSCSATSAFGTPKRWWDISRTKS